MTELLHFLLEHWALSSALVVVLLLIVIEEWYSRAGGVSSISPQKAVSLVNHQEAVFIDVRLPEVFKEGHILNAQNVPADQIDKQINSLQKYKSKPIIMIDQRGANASTAANKLRTAGFSAVYSLAGGIVAWRADGFPLTKE